MKILSTGKRNEVRTNLAMAATCLRRAKAVLFKAYGSHMSNSSIDTALICIEGRYSAVSGMDKTVPPKSPKLERMERMEREAATS